MKKFVILLVLMIFGVHCTGTGPFLFSTEEDEEEEKIDDWQFEPLQFESAQSYGMASSRTKNMAAPQAAAPMMAMSADSSNIGLSTGGAKDINNFRENIENNFLPLPSDLTYEGLFYDYFFDTGSEQVCNQLFCPSYTSAISKDPFSEQKDYFLSVGLNSGIKESDFARKKLELVIVLDISGSMSSPFDRYYYDQFKKENRPPENKEEWNKTKMQAASESVVALLDHLHPSDSFGVVLFDNQSYLAKPLRKVGRTKMKAIKGHILELQPQGGTNMSAGIRMGGNLLQEYASGDDEEVEKRIIFLTDAQPNTGELSERGMGGMTKDNAKNKIYTTFIGIGVDFNTELIELISKTRGGNYYSVHSPGEFKKRMDTNFDYMVTPLVFDLQLTVKTPGFEIQKVYGSPEADEATGEIMKVSTLFPSETEEGETRGGLVLLHLKKLSDSSSNTLELNVSYEDRQGKKNSHSVDFEFQDEAQKEYYDNTGIRKGIALSRYATLMKNWMLYERTGQKTPEGESTSLLPDIYQERGIFCFPDFEFELGRWERQSQELSVSRGYKKLFTQFIPYFEREMEAIDDDSMKQEKNILDSLANR